MDTKDANDWNEYRNARNTVNNEIKKRKSNYYKEACIAHKENPSKLWNTINEVCSRKPERAIVKNLEIGNQQITDSANIAEDFNEHFSTIGSTLIDAIVSNDVSPPKSFIEYLPTTNSVFSIKPTYPQQVLELMLKLSNKKATGLDGIASKLIKISAPVIISSITKIFNSSISTGIFLDEWKLARVTPVQKSGSLSDVNNYRPISINQCIVGLGFFSLGFFQSRILVSLGFY